MFTCFLSSSLLITVRPLLLGVDGALLAGASHVIDAWVKVALLAHLSKPGSYDPYHGLPFRLYLFLGMLAGGTRPVSTSRCLAVAGAEAGAVAGAVAVAVAVAGAGAGAGAGAVAGAVAGAGAGAGAGAVAVIGCHSRHSGTAAIDAIAASVAGMISITSVRMTSGTEAGNLH